AARRIGQEAVTLLRDEGAVVPVHADGPTVILTYAAETDIEAGRTFAAELRTCLPRARAARITPRWSRAQLDSLVRLSDRVVISTHVRTIEGEGRTAVAPQVAAWIDSLAATHTVIVAAHGNPYVIREFPHVGA